MPQPRTRDRLYVLALTALAVASVLAVAFGPWDRGWSGGLAIIVLVTAGGVALVWRSQATSDARPIPAPVEPVAQTAPPSTSALVAAADVHPDPMAIVEADEGGPRVAYANYAARDQLQMRAETALTSSVRHPRVLDRLERALERGAAGATLYQPAGEERTWRVFTVPLPGASPPARALMAFRDETDARAGQRLGSDFLANASHELRTPLASLTGFIETLRGHARDDPEARERFLAIMAEQAGRMGRLVDDLLTLSRIELNEHVPPRGSADLALAVGDVLDALMPVAAERGVRLEATLAPAGATAVEGDRDQIVQAAQNLIDNALKHAPSDSVVQVSVSVEPDGGAALEAARGGAARASLVSPVRPLVGPAAVLRVRDSGPGIPREHLPRLAERFYRVDGAQGRGTGLGLAIVRHVVNRHRGGFAVESLLGSGAVFTVALPLKGREAAE